MNNEWRTPIELYEEQNSIHHFEVDLAASDQYHLCEKYFSEKNSAFNYTWRSLKSCWCNPPYCPKGTIVKWVQKASCSIYHAKNIKQSLTIVMLLPVRTDQEWFHKYCLTAKVTFIKGRVKFLDENNKPGNAPREASMLITFKTIRS